MLSTPYSPPAGGGGGASVPCDLEWLETYEITGVDVTSFDFATVLDGDTDKVYVVEGIWIPAAGTTEALQQRCNGSMPTSGAYSGFRHFFSSSGGVGSDTRNTLNEVRVAATQKADTQEMFVHVELQAKSIAKRMLFARFIGTHSTDTNYPFSGMGTSNLGTFASNITSLGLQTVTVGGIKVGSKFNLYRKPTA